MKNKREIDILVFEYDVSNYELIIHKNSAFTSGESYF